jgi:hypothetical protein
MAGEIGDFICSPNLDHFAHLRHENS